MKRFLAVGFAVLALALSVIILDAPAKFSRPLFSVGNNVIESLTGLKTSFFEAYDPAQSPDVSLVGISNHHTTVGTAHALPRSGAAATQAVAAPEAHGATTSAADLTQIQTLVNQTFQSYIATGKLIGPQGSQGPQGIQGPQGPPSPAGSIQTFGSGGNSNDTSGTILGVTDLSARDLTVSNNTSLNNLTVSGSVNASSLNLTNALTVSNGGTGDSTLATDGIFYGNGTSAIGVTTAGNLGDCLQSNGTGNAPTFGSCAAGGARWDQLLNPNTNLALSMGANTTAFTYGAATGSNNLLNLTDTASNTGTGYLLNLTTAAGSTLKPLQVMATGNTALTIDSTGLLTANNFGSSSVAVTGGTESGVAITTGSINNTPIGATAPAAANFTTIGATTLGTGAFTSLSAKGMTNTGTLSLLTTTTPQLTVGYDSSNSWTSSTTSAGATTFTFNGSSSSALFKPQTDSTTAFNFTKADGLTSLVNIDTINGRVGIGTTTPAQTLDLESASPAVQTLGTTVASRVIQQVLSDGTARLIISDANTNGRRFDIVT
jgi:hypothetical protein